MAEELALRRLHKLQGRLVPRLYGAVEVDALEVWGLRVDGREVQGLAFEYLHGSTLWKWSETQHIKPVQHNQIASQLRACYGEISAYGVVQNDDKLDNVMIVDRTMAHDKLKLLACTGCLLLLLVRSPAVVLFCIIAVLLSWHSILTLFGLKNRMMLIDFDSAEVGRVADCMEQNNADAKALFWEFEERIERLSRPPKQRSIRGHMQENTLPLGPFEDRGVLKPWRTSAYSLEDIVALQHEAKVDEMHQTYGDETVRQRWPERGALEPASNPWNSETFVLRL